MDTDRKRAIITGALFIVATGAALAADGILGSTLDSPRLLAIIAGERARVVVATLLKVLAACASAGIAMSMYPVLRRSSAGLALGSVCFRLVEAVFYLVADLGLLSLLSLGLAAEGAGAGAATSFGVAAALVRALMKWSGFGIGVLAFCLGASLYYLALFRARLVPRWLSLWGLAALASLLTMVVLVLLGAEPEGVLLALALPIFLQELVLAAWLIFAGFRVPASAAGPDRRG